MNVVEKVANEVARCLISHSSNSMAEDREVFEWRSDVNEGKQLFEFAKSNGCFVSASRAMKEFTEGFADKKTVKSIMTESRNTVRGWSQPQRPLPQEANQNDDSQTVGGGCRAWRSGSDVRGLLGSVSSQTSGPGLGGTSRARGQKLWRYMATRRRGKRRVLIRRSSLSEKEEEALRDSGTKDSGACKEWGSIRASRTVRTQHPQVRLQHNYRDEEAGPASSSQDDSGAIHFLLPRW